MRLILPARKLSHDIRDFMQNIVSTCHILLVDQTNLKNLLFGLLGTCKEAIKNFDLLLEELIPMKTPPLNIMVVEDHDVTRQFLVKTLEGQGHKICCCAKDGNEMVDCALGQEDLDMIVFDIHLPGKDGLAALEEIKSMGRLIPALAITGDKDIALADRAAEEGVLNYLLKPIDPVQLLIALRVAWAKGQEFAVLQQENDTLQATMDKQRTVNRAKAILMRRKRMNEDQAFHFLQKLSMDRRTSLLEIARDVIDGKVQ